MEASQQIPRLLVLPILQSLEIAFIAGVKWFAVFLIQVLAAVVLAVVALYAVGFAPAILIGIGSLATPIATNQNNLVDAAIDTKNGIIDVIATLVSVANSVVECLEALEVIINIATELVCSIAKRITDVIPGVPDLFVWARMMQMERSLARSGASERAATAFILKLRDAPLAMQNMSKYDADEYRNKLEREFFTLPRGAPYYQREPLDKRSLTSLLQLFCNAFGGIVKFIISVVEVLSKFVRNLLDFVIEFFLDPSGAIKDAWEIIIVRFLLDTILEELGFAECFKDMPSSIWMCGCPWMYKQPYAYPSDIDFYDRDVPRNAGAAIIGCICFRPGVDFDADTSVTDLLLHCFYIDEIYNTIKLVYNFVKNTVMTVVNGIKDTIRTMKRQINKAVNQLKNLLKRVKDLFKRSDDASFDEAFAGRMHDLELLPLSEVIDGFEREYGTPDTYLDVEELARYERAMQALRDTPVAEFLRSARVGLRAFNATLDRVNTRWRAHSSLSFAERIMRRIERDPALTDFFASVTRSFDPVTRENFAAISLVFSETINAALLSIRDAREAHREGGARLRDVETRGMFDRRMDNVDFGSLVHAFERQARHLRRIDGEPEDKPGRVFRPIAAGATLAAGTLFGSEAFPHLTSFLRNTYTDDDIAKGAGFAARLGLPVQHVEDLRDHMQRSGIDVRDVSAEIEKVEMRSRETIAGRRAAAMKELDVALKNHEFARAGSAAIIMSMTGMVQGTVAIGSQAARFLPVVAPFALAPVLILAPLFLSEIVNVVLQAGMGTLMGALSSQQDMHASQMWSPSSPFINIFKDGVLDAYKKPLDFDDIQHSANLALNAGVWQLHYIVSLILQHSILGKLPLPLGSLSLPPAPLLDENGQPVQEFWEYLTDWFFCDPTRVCGDWDWCGANIPCRCPVNPGQRAKPFYRDVDDIPRQRDAVLGLPCRAGDVLSGVPRGYCHCHPFLKTGYNLKEPEADGSSSMDCAAEYGWKVVDAGWWDQSRWEYIKVLWHNTRIGLKAIVRAVLFKEPVKSENMFVGIAGALPCACMWPLAYIWTVVSVVINSTSTLRANVQAAFLRTAVQGMSLPLVGSIFEELHDFVHEPLRDGELTCILFNIATPITGAGYLSGILVIVAPFVIVGTPLTAFFVFLDVILLVVVGLPVYVCLVYMTSVRMAKAGMLHGGARGDMYSGAHAVQLIGARLKPRGEPRHNSHHEDISHDPHSMPLLIGNKAIVRQHPRVEDPGTFSAALEALRIMWRSRWLIISPRFVEAAWTMNPLQMREKPSVLRTRSSTMRAGVKSFFARHDHTTVGLDDPSVLEFLATEDGYALLNDKGYLVSDSNWYYGHLDVDEYSFHGARLEKEPIEEVGLDMDEILPVVHTSLRRRVVQLKDE